MALSITPAGGAAPSDTAYDATTWNGVTTLAPSKNAVRDKIEAMDALESWTVPTLINSWLDYGSGNQTTAFYKDRGRVYLRGFIKTGTSGTAAFVLPVGYRPTAGEYFKTASDGSNTDAVEITTAGNVIAYRGGSNYIGLNGISFRID